MMITMTTVMPVSRPVGHETFAVSARTCRMNSPGLVLAMNPLSVLQNLFRQQDRNRKNRQMWNPDVGMGRQ